MCVLTYSFHHIQYYNFVCLSKLSILYSTFHRLDRTVVLDALSNQISVRSTQALLFVSHTLLILVIPVELIDTEIDRFPITKTTCICSHMYSIEAKNTPVGHAGDAVVMQVTSSFGWMFPTRGRGTCSL